MDYGYNIQAVKIGLLIKQHYMKEQLLQMLKCVGISSQPQHLFSAEVFVCNEVGGHFKLQASIVKK